MKDYWGKSEIEYFEELTQHILWLMKLDEKQVKVVKELLKELWENDYWDGVDKHLIRGIAQSWANRIYEVH